MIPHAVIFSPIGQVSRAEQIIHRLSNAIISGLLIVDEQLPNEAELARLLGVSHITVREALNTLRLQGLLYTTRGRNGGSFVAGTRVECSLQYNPFERLSSDYLTDLAEWHCAILSHSASLAANRMTKQDCYHLTEHILVLRNATTPEMRCQADIRCLLTIAANSQSSRLANQELALQSEWASLIIYLYHSADFHTAVTNTYQLLINALADSNSILSSKLATQLMNYYAKKLIEYKLSHS